jgi:hypothetical protein
VLEYARQNVTEMLNSGPASLRELKAASADLVSGASKVPAAATSPTSA